MLPSACEPEYQCYALHLILATKKIRCCQMVASSKTQKGKCWQCKYFVWLIWEIDRWSWIFEVSWHYVFVDTWTRDTQVVRTHWVFADTRWPSLCQCWWWLVAEWRFAANISLCSNVTVWWEFYHWTVHTSRQQHICKHPSSGAPHAAGRQCIVSSSRLSFMIIA